MTLNQPPPGAIVVGIDGSAGADRSLEWAVEQAVLERRPLAVLHAMNLLGPGQTTLSGTSLIGPPDLFDAVTEVGSNLLAQAVRRARALAPELETYEVLSQADPRVALLEASARATVVVVGSRGRGPVQSLLLGSVSVAVSKHATCPTVIVRPQESGVARHGILVGVTGTGRDRDVVRFAFELASQRRTPLTVMHCFWDAAHLGSDEQHVAVDEPRLDDQRLLLREAVRSAQETYPDVRPSLELARGFADQRLIERSRDMDVVVVGSCRPSPPHLGRGHGWIAPTVVEHARCAVAVIPHVD